MARVIAGIGTDVTNNAPANANAKSGGNDFFIEANFILTSIQYSFKMVNTVSICISAIC